MDLSITQMENNDTLSTTLRLDKSSNIRAIRPRLYKHGTPDGTLTLTIKDGATTLASQTLTMATLDAAVGTFFHGYVKFEYDSLVVKKDPESSYKEITIELSLSGHTDSSTNYIGWCHNFSSDIFVSSYGTIPNESDMTEAQLTHSQPYGIELYTF